MEKQHSHGLRTTHSIMPWLVWLFAVGFYSYEFLQRVSISVYLGPMMKALSANAAEISLLSSCYYYAYAIMQLPAGALVDRYGPKKLALAGLLVLIIGTFGQAAAGNIWLGAGARFLVGLGSAFAFVCTLQFIIVWFPANQFAKLAGLTNFMGYLGATFGEVPLAKMVHYFHWRTTINLTAVLGIVIFLLIAIIVKDKPLSHHRGIKRPKPKKKIAKSLHIFTGLKAVVRLPRNWFNGIYCGLVVGPTSAFAALWGIKFLTSADHLSHANAAGVLSAVFFGVAAGSPLFGWASDYWNKRQIFLMLSAFGGALCTLIIIFDNSINIGLLYTISFLFGLCQSGHVLCFATAKDDNNRHYSGTAISFINMALIIGGAFMQPAIGIVLDWLNAGQPLQQLGVYSAHVFHMALIVLPICQILAGMIAWLLLPDQHAHKMRLGH